MTWSNRARPDKLIVEKSHSLSVTILVQDRLHRDVIDPTDECWLTVRPVEFTVDTDDLDATITASAVQASTPLGMAFRFDIQASSLNLDPELEWWYDITYVSDGYSTAIKSGPLEVGANVTNRGAGKTFTGGLAPFTFIAQVQDRALINVTSSLPPPAKGDTGFGVYATSSVLAGGVGLSVAVPVASIQSYGRALQVGDLLVSSTSSEWMAYVSALTYTGPVLTGVTATTSLQILGPEGPPGPDGPPGPPGLSTAAVSTDAGNLLEAGTDGLALFSGDLAHRAVPVATVMMYVGAINDIPTYWALADGSEYDPAAWPELFAKIGNTFGGTSSNPRLPSFTGRVAVGLDTSETMFNQIGKTGGTKRETLSIAELPSHTHVQNAHTHVQNAHTHVQNAHTHTSEDHAHGPGSLSGYYETRDVDATGTTVTGAIGERYPAYDLSSSPGSVIVDNGMTSVASVLLDPAVATNQSTTAVNQETVAVNQMAGGGGSHNNVPPYLTVPFIIKVV